MAYDEALADRVRDLLGARAGVTECKMFGGIAFMVHGNMAVGVRGEELMVRVDEAERDRLLEDPAVRTFDMQGRPTRGFVLVAADAVATDDGLSAWLDAGADHAASLPPKASA